VVLVSAVRKLPGKKPRTVSVASAVERMTFEQLECRDFGHAWAPYTARLIGNLGGYEYTLRCGRCLTERYRQIGRTGRLLQNKYRYEPGYLIKGLGQLTTEDRDEFRLAMVRAVLKQMGES
jgi:hypothetical protein